MRPGQDLCVQTHNPSPILGCTENPPPKRNQSQIWSNMSAQPLEQLTILFSCALGQHICVDHLYRGASVADFEHKAFRMFREVPNVQLGVTTNQNRNTGRRGGDCCESVPIQAVKCKTAMQHTHLVKKNHYLVSTLLQHLTECHYLGFYRVFHIESQQVKTG